jgi:NtrC-family two-component system sensor histidine kinase KinB
MKISIRKRFTIGMGFFFVIIASITVLSVFHLNNLSKKTEAILQDNHLSIIYARDMAEALTILNQELTRCFVTESTPDKNLLGKTTALFEKSLALEKLNITETGEDKLVSGIESGFNKYKSDIASLQTTPKSANTIITFQFQFHTLYQQTVLLSQMNEQAIMRKADDAKKSAEKGLTHVTILGSIFFIITLSFTYNFASYFNERFTKLYNGIREIGSNNYSQRLHFEGEDEFYDISLVFNNMAQNLSENKPQVNEKTQGEANRDANIRQVKELKRILEQMEATRERANELIAKLGNKV